jgi:NADH-quinone oxidoreductase subunit G
MSEPGGEKEMVTLTIDDVEVTVPTGTRVLDAAQQAGVVVPFYCYHPGIPTRPAQCRVCLVSVEGQGKLQPSCVLEAGEGMVVHTATDEARQARKSVIEFLLLNHPLDCPICDAAGQCMLQDYAFETGQLESRVDEAKLVMGRDRIADDILYFADRCIICTRCVRFMREVAEDDALVVAERGHRAYIDTFPGRKLDHPFQGNIVDVCPVGALVHEDFLFKARFWDMDSASSICPGCSTGCNVSIASKENQIVRLKPRHNAEVNSYWMCDYGRKHLVMANRGIRAEVPLLRDPDGELRPADWKVALERVASAVAQAERGRAVVSAHACNESLFGLRRLLDRMGIEGGEFRVEQGEEATLSGFSQLQLRADRAPNVAGAELFGFQRVEELTAPTAGEALVVLAERLEEDATLPEESFGDEASYVLYLGTRLTSAARRADAILPITSFAEMQGTFTNWEGRVQRFDQALREAGIARPAWMVLSRLLALLEGDEGTLLDASEAFEAMAKATPDMGEMDWPSLGPKGLPLARSADVAGGRG